MKSESSFDLNNTGSPSRRSDSKKQLDNSPLQRLNATRESKKDLTTVGITKTAEDPKQSISTKRTESKKQLEFTSLLPKKMKENPKELNIAIPKELDASAKNDKEKPKLNRQGSTSTKDGPSTPTLSVIQP